MFSLQKELFKNWRYVFFWTGHFHSVKLLVYAYWNDADSKSHFATQADEHLDSAHLRVKSSCHFLLFPCKTMCSKDVLCKNVLCERCKGNFYFIYKRIFFKKVCYVKEGILTCVHIFKTGDSKMH